MCVCVCGVHKDKARCPSALLFLYFSQLNHNTGATLPTADRTRERERETEREREGALAPRLGFVYDFWCIDRESGIGGETVDWTLFKVCGGPNRKRIFELSGSQRSFHVVEFCSLCFSSSFVPRDLLWFEIGPCVRWRVRPIVPWRKTQLYYFVYVSAICLQFVLRVCNFSTCRLAISYLFYWFFYASLFCHFGSCALKKPKINCWKRSRFQTRDNEDANVTSSTWSQFCGEWNWRIFLGARIVILCCFLFWTCWLFTSSNLTFWLKRGDRKKISTANNNKTQLFEITTRSKG